MKKYNSILIALVMTILFVTPAMAQDSPGFWDRLFGTGRAQVSAKEAVDVSTIEAVNAVDVATIEANANQAIAAIDQRAREAIARAENDASLLLADKNARIEEIKASAGQQMATARASADIAIAEADERARKHLSDGRVSIAQIEGDTSIALADERSGQMLASLVGGVIMILAAGIAVIGIVLAFRKTDAPLEPSPVKVLPYAPQYPQIDYDQLAGMIEDAINRKLIPERIDNA